MAAHLCRAARIRPVADPPPDVSEEDALSGTMLLGRYGEALAAEYLRKKGLPHSCHELPYPPR